MKDSQIEKVFNLFDDDSTSGSRISFRNRSRPEELGETAENIDELGKNIEEEMQDTIVPSDRDAWLLRGQLR